MPGGRRFLVPVPVLAVPLAVLLAVSMAVLLSPSQAAASPTRESWEVATADSAGAALRTPQQYGAAVVRLANKARNRRDLPLLSRKPCLDLVAQRWARRMARTGDLVHNDFGSVRTACHRQFGGGENIAVGYATPRAVVAAWMHSAGHRANMLRRGHGWIGVSAARDAGGNWWWVQDFARVG